MRYLFSIVFAIVILILTVVNSFAYLDPGTGSMMFQIVTGVILAAFFTVKLWWNNLLKLIFRFREKDSENGEGKR